MPKKQTNQPKAKKPAKGQNVAQPQKGAPPSFVQLSSTSTEYFKCLLNPCGADPVGMPWGFPCPSLKQKTFIRTRFTTATSTSRGFVLLDPWLMVASNGFGSSALIGTAAGWVGSTTTGTTDGSTVIGYNSNSSFASTDFADDLCDFRLVSACLRVRYAGTELSRGGRCVALIAPDHAELTGLTASGLLANDSAVSCAVSDGEWTEVIYNGPVSPWEAEYIDGADTTFDDTWCMCIWVDSAAAAATFEVEAYANFEIVGSLARGKTATLTDPVGGALVSSAITNAQLTVRTEHHGSKTFIEKAVSLAKNMGMKALTGLVGKQPDWGAILGHAAKRGLPLIAGMM